MHILLLGGGYAILRSSWKDEKNKATWMMFVASTFSSTHKHGDDLEVLLYHKGDLFVEAGKRNYNYSDEKTAWAYSGYAHNVLLVDGEAYPVRTGANGFQAIYPKALETKIIGYCFEDNVQSISGRECRFANVGQTRTLTYDRMNAMVGILDVLEASKDFEGTLLYHIAEGVRVAEKRDGWNLFRGSELVAVVEVETTVEFEIRTVTGSNTVYPYHTWIFDGNDEPAYGSVLIIKIAGKTGNNEIKTIINLK